MRALRSTSVFEAERRLAALLRGAAAAALCAALAGCSSDKAEPPASSPDGGNTKPEPPSCPAPGHVTGGSPLTFNGLSATVLDENGAPAKNVSAQACGINVCINGKTDGNGVAHITEKQPLKGGAFKYGGGQNYARFALLLDLPASDGLELGEQRTVSFDPPSEGALIEAGESATSRGATITLSSDATAEPDPFDFETDDLKKFRAAEVPEAVWPDVVDRSLNFALLVALTPSDTEICPAAKLTLANTPELSPGTRVEFFVHGTDVIERWAPYGGWAKVSDGEVSPDGAAIETDPSGGIPVLSVIGVRVTE
jgi:hypothetical protein